MDRDELNATEENYGKGNRYLPGVIMFCLMLCVFFGDYLIHPEARATQRRIKQELQGLPLPPSTSEKSFSSGYQPAKGRAVRVLASGMSERQICDFYDPILKQAGWTKIRDACYPASESRALATFEKNKVVFEIFFVPNRGLGQREYELQEHWVSN